MQTFNLLTYSDQKYRPLQAKLVEEAIASQAFDFVLPHTRKDLESSIFYKENKAILDLPRGGGYWLWKPFFILRALANMNEGDLLLYMDCGDSLHEVDELRDAAFQIMQDKFIYLTDGAFKNSDWTKRDTFVIMGCDKEAFYDAIQVEAGIILVKKTARTVEILTEWLSWCKNAAVVTDNENVCQMPNLDGFKDHRHDQSILTNLRVKWGLWSGNLLRKFIHCNTSQI